MTVGDSVAVITTQVGNYGYYIPAAGIEVMISWLPSQLNYHCFLTDGTTDSPWQAVTTSGAGAIMANNKIFITNSIYIGVYTTAPTGGISGIQIK